MGINPNNVSNSNLQSALVVTSPIGGTVSNVFAKIGSYVDVSSPVAEIVDNSSLHLDLNIFEKRFADAKKVGQTIHFTLTNNPLLKTMQLYLVLVMPLKTTAKPYQYIAM